MDPASVMADVAPLLPDLMEDVPFEWLDAEAAVEAEKDIEVSWK